MTQFYSNGKLLLSAEYVVIDSALALALPTKYGQTLVVELIDKRQSVWESYDSDGHLWFKASFSLSSFDFFVDKQPAFNNNIATQLQKILKAAREFNPNFLKTKQNYKISTKLGFLRHWGLGSSSTLINNVAQWAKIDAFKLQLNTFGGSAYDIACAQNNTPVLYQLNQQKPMVKQVNFNPTFKHQLYFVYLNKKQNSREGIEKYNLLKGNISKTVLEISNLTKEISKVETLDVFENLIATHEQIISKLIKIKPIQELAFKDYFGQTKSLGAWGGDFILATGNNDTPAYFKNKGFKTVIAYSDMVL